MTNPNDSAPDRSWPLSPSAVIGISLQFSRISEELAARLRERYGGDANVPQEFKQAWWLFSMALKGAEEELQSLIGRVARDGAPLPPPSASAGIAGEETGEF